MYIFLPFYLLCLTYRMFNIKNTHNDFQSLNRDNWNTGTGNSFYLCRISLLLSKYRIWHRNFNRILLNIIEISMPCICWIRGWSHRDEKSFLSRYFSCSSQKRICWPFCVHLSKGIPTFVHLTGTIIFIRLARQCVLYNNSSSFRLCFPVFLNPGILHESFSCYPYSIRSDVR